MNRVWVGHYPEGVSPDIEIPFNSLCEAFDHAFEAYADCTMYSCLGASLTYADVDRLSRNFAAYLQHNTNLHQGDPIAIQLPNILQFPVALFGALRAGLKVVNTNPLYTPREMQHQFTDAGAKAIIILADLTEKLDEIIEHTLLETVITTAVADQFQLPTLTTSCPAPQQPSNPVPFLETLKQGAQSDFDPVNVAASDVAFLQYTGGTTGPSKGAMLTHGNVVANVVQTAEWMQPYLDHRSETIITPLPLYHIFSLTVNCLTMGYFGAHSVLIPNPRDLDTFLEILKSTEFTMMTGLNTLFNSMMNHPGFGSVDWSGLKVCVAGGMAMQTSVSLHWLELTGCRITEGYGLTESSPVLTVNPYDETAKYGTIGLPLPSTWLKIVDDNGNELPQGEVGEIWAKGPQVMLGYHGRPEETRKTLTDDGWLKTGDMAYMDPDGFFKIVDRKKDMILVSGFNVYPNEIEDVVSQLEGIFEVAAIGVPDDKSGEAVKLFVVKSGDNIDRDHIVAYCKKNLAAYKMPKHIDFIDELPKSNVGKVLRKELRDL